jgi:carboxylate-amine ligase
MMASPTGTPDAAELRRRFDQAGGLTVGIEEETMLLDPETLDLAPVSSEALRLLGGDPRFKAELPAAQLEIVISPQGSAPAAIAQLAAARRDLAKTVSGLALPAVAGAHPFAASHGVLNPGARYDEIRQEYGPVAHRQLVAALQIHVAVGGADRSLAVYNALRSLLPELTALSANAPFYAGADSGLATVRPGICEQLPRQGVPPVLRSWEHWAAELKWGAVAGALPEASRWWWELRPHPVHGTLELRVPDAQTTVGQAAGVVAFAQALVAHLSERYDAGDPLPNAPTWRIEENRWSASRHGLEGSLADLRSGRRRRTRQRLLELLDEIEPVGRRIGAADLFGETRAVIARNGASRQREVYAARGLRGLAAWLAGQFT